jgi:anaerobic selenocysteine-containing dehydrogenase
MVPIGSCWHTRGTMIIRTVLLVAALVAAIVAGLLVYSKNGRSQSPAPTCTVANCDATLPGGWPSDPTS